MINKVLDQAAEKGLLLERAAPYPDGEGAADGAPAPQMTYRDHIIKEMVDTERKYVQDLENLYDLKKALEQHGVLTGDTVHAIFLNINAILDFQRRFLIKIETTNSQPQNMQRWGSAFVVHEDGFGIYTPFIANQRKAAQTAQGVFDKIQQVDNAVACDFNTLDGFLLKPMQRLVKYPLLLKVSPGTPASRSAKGRTCLILLRSNRTPGPEQEVRRPRGEGRPCQGRRGR